MKIKSLPIIGALFLVFAMTVQFFVSFHRETENVENHIENRMKIAEKKFLFEVYDMYEAADEIVHFFPQYSGEGLFTMLSTVLGRFPNLYCCYVAYMPQSSPMAGKRFAPCAFRQSGSTLDYTEDEEATVGEDTILTYDYGDKVDYLERDWYSGALLANDEGYWSLPYNDADHKDPVFTYSRAVRDEHGNVIAVAGADYTLAWTQQLLDDIKPYDDALCQLYSTDGQLVVECGHVETNTQLIKVEKRLTPTTMRLVIAVPKSHLLKAVWRVSLLTLMVLLVGVFIAAWLIRRIWRDQKELVRVETNNQVMERELHIANSMQQGILRHDFPDDDVLQLGAALMPMHEVGGDLYDYYLIGDDLYFIIGDVSGKGIPATIFMSAAVNLFRSSVRRVASPKEIVAEMNALLSDNNPSLTFVTAFVGKLHIPTGELLYCNAAHNEPLIIHNSQFTNHDSPISFLPVKPNIPLGYDGEFPYVEQGLLLECDDVLVLYTDGITEARNPERKMFGKERLAQAASKAPLGQAGEVILEAVQTFIDGVPSNTNNQAIKQSGNQSDDITLMTTRRKQVSQPVTLRITNRLNQWPLLRERLHQYGLCLGMDLHQLKKIELAIEEAVVNVISYAYPSGETGNIEMTLSHHPSSLSITISDLGTPFDPLQVEGLDKLQTDDRRIGGLGIHLLRQIADDITYTRTPDGQNRLTIVVNCEK